MSLISTVQPAVKVIPQTLLRRPEQHLRSIKPAAGISSAMQSQSPKQPIILYDNPSRFGTGTTWSPNVWKTRLLLNFKGLNYKTEWLHGPDLARTFKSFGIPPHPPKTQLADYTIPAVRLADGTYIMDSKSIALALEREYPLPSAHLDSPMLKQVEEAWAAALKALRGVLVPRMPRECLSGPTIAYHIEARERTFGMTLEEVEAKFGGEAAWEKAMPALRALAGLLNTDSTGPFCLGKMPSYADFLIVGFLEWCKCLRGGNYERIVDIDHAFQEVYDACRPWLARNDH